MPFSSLSGGRWGRGSNPSPFLLHCFPCLGEIPHSQLSPTHQGIHHTTPPPAAPQSLRSRQIQPCRRPCEGRASSRCPRGLVRVVAAKGRGSCPAGCSLRAPKRGRPGSVGQGRPSGVAVRRGHRGWLRRRGPEVEGYRVLLTRRRHRQQLGQVRVAAIILDLPVDDAARDLQRLLRGGRRGAHGGGHGGGGGAQAGRRLHARPEGASSPPAAPPPAKSRRALRA